jgi:hypothetical protein
MLSRKQQIKQKTRVDKITCPCKDECLNRKLCGHLKSTELTECSNSKDMKNASLVFLPSVSQSRRESTSDESIRKIDQIDEKVTSHFQKWIPVISSTSKPLMPCSPARARELLKNKKAIPKWKVGIFYIQLTERSDGVVQVVAVGIDPGSKREAFTIKSKEHTYLNILSDAVTHVKDAIEIRKAARMSRRSRKTPCRKCRHNRKGRSLSPSTKARWNAKLRIVNIIVKIYPITNIIVEDIKAISKKGNKKWNKSFSPLEVGKIWFYSELKKIAILDLKQGYETAELRKLYNLVKTSSKLENIFSAHNIDSWALANTVTNSLNIIDNKSIVKLIPLRFYRRQLHVFQYINDCYRKKFGGTISLSLKKGSLIIHKKYGLCYIGGKSKVGISLHNLKTGNRLCQNAKKKDLKILRYNYWRSNTIK